MKKTDKQFESNKINELDLELIEPDPGQHQYHTIPSKNLLSSFKTNEMKQPILVRLYENGKGIIVDDECRYNTAKQLGFKTIPVKFDGIDGSEKMFRTASFPNSHLKSLIAIEAKGLKKIQDNEDLIQIELGKKIGVKQNDIKQHLGLTKLPKIIKTNCQNDYDVSKSAFLEISKMATVENKPRSISGKIKKLFPQREKQYKKDFSEPVKKRDSQIHQNNEEYYIDIFESEIRFMAHQAYSCGNLETGGELFGLFSHNRRPVIMLATPAGGKSIKNIASFQQDYQFFNKITKILQNKYGLQYLANFHSHHSLDFKTLSRLDIENLNSIAKKNNLSKLCQFLLTFENDVDKNNLHQRNKNHANYEIQFVQLHSYFYSDAINGGPVKCPIRILPGMSPVRQAINNDPDLSEIAKPYHFPLSRTIYDEYQTNPNSNCKSSLPSPIQDQINMFMEVFSRSISITF